MKKLIVVADWAHDSLTNQEVRTAIEGFSKNPNELHISFVSSTPSTLHTSYLLQQLVRTEERYGRPGETVFFQNTDPRVQTKEGVEQAKGAEFIVIRLKSGIYLCGPNAGYDFSLLKPSIEYVYRYPGLDKGSQFRSRDLYSRISAHLIDEMEDELDLEEQPSNCIPELRGYFVGHVDNYGNIKTTITHEDLKGKVAIGEKVEIEINDVKKSALYVNNLFGGTPGELVIYPGSSGDPSNPYIEVSVWRHFTEKDASTGVHAFNMPRPGMEIVLS
ncbi:MAG: SAM-dependent chlorinase/fluorinase [Candidatus Roizmanbacteria bacterium]|nr:SAM-dependent chlorinase/fluorinase [Candidatus Roizmanbacteria bacterium]